MMNSTGEGRVRVKIIGTFGNSSPRIAESKWLRKEEEKEDGLERFFF
jgi:hypothetical protein